jgi:hypothetical protein
MTPKPAGISQAEWDKAFQRGQEDAAQHADALQRYGHRPPDKCPYLKDSPEEQAYDAGWEAYMVGWL